MESRLPFRSEQSTDVAIDGNATSCTPLSPNEEYLYTLIRAARKLFDALFADISPIRLYDNPNGSDSVKILRDSLSDVQCCAIAELSGYISTIETHLQNRHEQDQSSKDLTFSAYSIKYPLVSHSFESSIKTNKKIMLLQEMLVYELNRSENAERALLNVEEEVRKLNDEKESFLKKIAKLEKTQSKANVEKEAVVLTEIIPPEEKKKTSGAVEPPSQINANPSDPLQMLGQFVRKRFDGKWYLGIITNYRTPYFKVRTAIISLAFSMMIYDFVVIPHKITYADGDREDAEWKELNAILYGGYISVTMQVKIYSHAKRLRVAHPALNVAEKLKSLNARPFRSSRPGNSFSATETPVDNHDDEREASEEIIRFDSHISANSAFSGGERDRDNSQGTPLQRSGSKKPHGCNVSNGKYEVDQDDEVSRINSAFYSVLSYGFAHTIIFVGVSQFRD